MLESKHQGLRCSTVIECNEQHSRRQLRNRKLRGIECIRGAELWQGLHASEALRLDAPEKLSCGWVLDAVTAEHVWGIHTYQEQG